MAEKEINGKAPNSIILGKMALAKAVTTASDVSNAIYRDDIGFIDFIWGVPGEGKNFKRGYGLAHLIAKRDSEDGTGMIVAEKLVEVIAKGTDVERQNSFGGNGEYRLKIHYDGYTAVLSSATPTRNAWLLTGWKNKKSND